MKKKSSSQSAFFSLRTLVVVALFVIGIALFASGAFSSADGANPRQKSSGMHKLSVRDRQLVALLKDRGAQIIADYGGFVLLEANDTLTRDAVSTGKAETVDYNN